MRTLVAELRALSAEAALGKCLNETWPLPEERARVWSPASMNFAVSNGRGMVVTRFRSKADEDPPSMYYKMGVPDRYRADTGASSLVSAGSGRGQGDVRANGLIVASEPLEETLPALSAWRLLGKDKMISFHPSEGVRVECLSDRCSPDLPADIEAAEMAEK